MASQGPNNPSNAGQPQAWKNDMLNQQSDSQNQDHSTNFLQETGTQVKNMAQGAADIGKGAVVSIARGAALGAANVAQGAADVVKNTVGSANNATTNTNTASGCPGSTTDTSLGSDNNATTNTNTASGCPGTTTDTSLGTGNYPSSNHPSNPNTRI
ncbi:unnamed protein product [Fraxinus pennsylvanica]|uniref:Uncharacterized protein n=1 Tax=Fraxinus pennsylvanica TaxID=56036 RepID=A0AAD1ZAR7_9LAMI|nr:unnamed protein product [Fraxinus pennsylvanica]